MNGPLVPPIVHYVHEEDRRGEAGDLPRPNLSPIWTFDAFDTRIMVRMDRRTVAVDLHEAPRFDGSGDGHIFAPSAAIHSGQKTFLNTSMVICTL